MLNHYKALRKEYGDYDHYTTGYDDAIDTIASFPAADVVPKSEVVLANRDAMKLLLEVDGYAKTHDQDVKREVAREIFEEIERLCDAHLYWNNCSIIQRDDIAELKKKYTEGCTTCAHIVSCEPNPFGTCKEYEERHDE